MAPERNNHRYRATRTRLLRWTTLRSPTAGIFSIYPHLSVNQEAAAALTYEGRIPLAIGVELMELVYEAGRKIFLKVMPDAEKIRAPSSAMRGLARSSSR